MKNLARHLLFPFALAMLTIFGTASAWAVPCGDNTPLGTDTACDCGDTVTSHTVLDSSDPVVYGGCFPVGLFVADNVNLDAHSLNPAAGLCDRSSGGFTTGIWVIGDDGMVEGGIIEGCDVGIFLGGGVERNTIKRVTVRFNGIGIYVLFNNRNKLLNNLCDNNDFEGILVFSDANILERNRCQLNGGTGIVVFSAGNILKHNQGRNNGGQGVFVQGGNITTDLRNYGSGNGVKPDCEINGQSVPGTGGKYC